VSPWGGKVDKMREVVVIRALHWTQHTGIKPLSRSYLRALGVLGSASISKAVSSVLQWTFKARRILPISSTTAVVLLLLHHPNICISFRSNKAKDIE